MCLLEGRRINSLPDAAQPPGREESINLGPKLIAVLDLCPFFGQSLPLISAAR
jgi:hypothetical protein